MTAPLRRVLIVVPWFYGFERSVPRAFERCGCEVHARVYFPHDTFANKVRNRLVGEVAPRVGLDLLRRRRAETFNRELRDTAAVLRPDLVVVMKGEILDPETVRVLHRRSQLLYWAIDDPARFPSVMDVLSEYDAAVAFSRAGEALLRQHVSSVHFLLNGYDDEIFHPVPPGRLSVDVSFVGARYPEREQALRVVLASGASVGIWGGDWRRMPWRARFYQRRDALDACARGGADLEKSNAVYNGIPVNLNIHGAWDGLNTRVFEIPGAGGFQLCDAQPGLEEVLTPGEEVAVYHDLAELGELTAFYLRDEGARRCIAEAGRRRVAGEHTWTHRIGELLGFLDMR